jgi:hypothetical protein
MIFWAASALEGSATGATVRAIAVRPSTVS